MVNSLRLVSPKERLISPKRLVETQGTFPVGLPNTFFKLIGVVLGLFGDYRGNGKENGNYNFWFKHCLDQ